MKKLVFALILSFASISAHAQTCKVTDPTGTPLNARAAPNGKIIGKVKNSTVVYVSEYSYDNKGRPWALILMPKMINISVGYIVNLSVVTNFIKIHSRN